MVNGKLDREQDGKGRRGQQKILVTVMLDGIAIQSTVFLIPCERSRT